MRSAAAVLYVFALACGFPSGIVLGYLATIGVNLMEIAAPLFQAIVLGIVCAVVWAFGDNSWVVRPLIFRAITFALLAWAAFVGPIPLG